MGIEHGYCLVYIEHFQYNFQETFFLNEGSLLLAFPKPLVYY